MQNQQAQIQEFLNNVSNLENTPPDKTNEVLMNMRNFYQQIVDQQALGFVLFKVAEHIMRLKATNEYNQWMLEQCIYDVITKSASSEFRVGSEALKTIFDCSSDYYKHSSQDPSLKFPLGHNRKLNWYEPEVGESVDVVKPYITSTSFCSWTRGILVGKENKKYTVKYQNSDATATYKDLPFFDKLGERTKDFDWRMGLDIGSTVDAYNRVWYPSTVVQVGVENGQKRVRISFRRFSQNGEKIDSLGYRYDGLGPNEDDWIDVLSYRIQKPDKMAKQLCYYSHSSEQVLIDDTYDLLFQKQYQQNPFWGLMRCTYTRSTTYLNFFQHLCNQRGYQIFLDILKRKDFPMDSVINMMMIFGYTSFMVPRMGLRRYLPQCFDLCVQYLKDNLKNFNPMRLDVFYYFITSVGNRLFSLSQKHKILNDIRKFLSVEYLKLNLEKNLLALRFLYELIRPQRPYQNEKEKEELDKFLVESQIFYKIIQNNVHEQVLSRSVQLLKYMMDSHLIGWNEIQHIWKVIPHSDLRGRATIEKLLGDVSKSFKPQFTEKLLDLLLSLKETDLTIDKLNLLRSLKDRDITNQYKQKIMYYLWECLTVKSTNIKQNVEEEVETVYRGFISTIKHNSLRLTIVKDMLKRINEIATVRNQMVLFKQFIETYPKKLQSTDLIEQGDYPKTIKQVISFLKKENIYETVLKLLANVKNRQRTERTLEFLQFLFDYDSDDISLIVKLAYDILGPSDVFLLWAKNLAFRALNFFIDMYENTQNMEKFEKITNSGLDSIKTILLDINFYKGNIKILKKKKTTAVLGPVGPQNKQGATNSVGTSTAEYSLLRPPQKQQTLTFIYVLKSPFECIGLNFLLKLLQYISSNSVYNDVIKLIIQFIVNLDDKILGQAQNFMEQFLQRIIKNIEEIAKANFFDNSIKLQLEIYINLLVELFAETEVRGLGSMVPHFSIMEGETLRLKIENSITNSDIHKKEPYIIEINENQTLWKLKVLLAPVYGLPPTSVDIVKYVNPIEEVNHGKSLSQLFFFNEEGIKIQKKGPREIPRFELLTEDHEALTQRFDIIVEGWFNKYKNEKQMLGIDELMKLGKDNWTGSILKEKDKLMGIISKNDKDEKGGLFLHEFKQYFIKSSIQNSQMVWRLINLSGYLNNLRHSSEPEIELGETFYPRKLLSHKFVYQTIFSILSNQTFQPLHLNFYRFLGMLQTDYLLCSEIKSNIKEFFTNEKCMYKFSYGLETLIKELENNIDLFSQFYEHGGHIEIANKLAGLFEKDQSVYKMQQFLKVVVIPNLLKILSLYVYPFIAENKYARFLKKNKVNLIDTVDIIKKIDIEENYAEDQADRRAILAARNTNFNFEELYKLAYKILCNLIANYDKEFLVRMTNEIAKLYGYLAVANPNFRPEELFAGCNSDSLNIRRSCHGLIYIYFLQNKGEAFSLVQKLIGGVPQDMKPISNTYFDLLAIILEKTIELEALNQKSQQFFNNLSIQLVQAFYKAPNEQRGAILSNKIIYGILNSLLIILKKMPKIGERLSVYKEYFITKGLFAYGIKQRVEELKVDPSLLVEQNQLQHFDDYVKCKTEQNRKILMEVIYHLYKYSKDDNHLFFQSFILPILDELGDTSKKNSSRTMHVGLTNYGSTCYLNSMLQALNSMDIFRNAIMMTEAETPLVHELKALFSYLFFSERIDYGPKNLLNSFVPPINPGIQQDTTEFLNFLFDQVQQSLKTTPYKKILPELFQGNQVAQMICHNCGAKRERVEEFFTYSVQIQGKYDLHSALQGMHGGELISDCLCQTCENRSDTTKRNVLNKVPNIFFVHLKRIVFNYDVFMNTKIHTRLFFPDELNFQPYTKEGLELRENLGVEYMKTLNDNEQEKKKFEERALHGHPKEYYQLKLKAIIVHSGTPDVGHYYTILKKGNNWVKFDDSRVTTFGQVQFEEECYGGSWIADEWGGPGSSKNAYVLVYEKEFKNDIELEIKRGENQIQKKIVPYQQFCKTYNTVEWYKDVWLDNHSLMLQQQLITENYTKQFLSFVCKMLQLLSSEATVDLISQILFKISLLSGEVGTLPQIFEKNLDKIKLVMFKQYLLSDTKRTFNLLFHQQAKVREFASFYIERILIFTYLNGSAEDKVQVMKFIESYLHILHSEVAKNWLRIDGYFRMFERLVETSIKVPECYQIYKYFITKDILTYFVDFVLEKSSPLNFIQKKYSLGTKTNPLNFNAGLGIVATLVKHSYNMTGNNYEATAINPSYLFHLSDNAVVCLSCMSFYEKMIKQNQNPEAIGFLIERLSINNIGFSDAISRILLKIVNQNTEVSDEMETVLLCIGRFLRITDELWIKRAEAVLGTPTPFIYDKNILSSLDEEKYVFPSTLENIFPLESLLNYAHINRLRIPLTVLNILKTILEATGMNDYTMNFLLKMPSPSYIYLRYIDWVRPYVNEVINQLNISDKKKEEVVSKISLCNLYLDDLQKKKKDMFTLMIGEIGQKKLISKINSPCEDVYINIYSVPVYVVESFPTGVGNATFDAVLTNYRLEKLATENSNILKFFKQSSKPLAIKGKPVEEPEDKQLVGLFDQNPYPDLKINNAETSTDHAMVPQQKKEIPMEIEKAPVSKPNQKQEVEEFVQQKVREEINIQHIRLSQDYLRCMEFVNKTDSSKVVIAVIKNLSNCNHTLPSTLKFLIGKTTEDFYYTKFHPFEPWGELEYEIYAFNNVQNPRPFFRNYHLPMPQMNEGHAESNPQSKQSLFQRNNQMEVQQKKEEKADAAQNQESGMQGMMSCPFCTSFNPMTNTSCDVCESQFPK